MNNLILVRYGEYTDGHINDTGRTTMASLAGRLKPVIAGQKTTKLVTATIARARESAGELAAHLQIPVSAAFPELTAAEEHGMQPDVDRALTVLQSEGRNTATLIAVLSREYIETIPGHILDIAQASHLDRGQALMLDMTNKTSVTI